MEHPKETVLAHHREVRAARRKRQFVYTAALCAEHPSVQRIASFGFTRMDGVAVPLLVRLVVRGGVAARKLLIVQIKLARAVRSQEQVLRARHPTDARHLRLID